MLYVQGQLNRWARPPRALSLTFYIIHGCDAWLVGKWHIVTQEYISIVKAHYKIAYNIYNNSEMGCRVKGYVSI